MFLFFFKQKTAYEMRISDWSSDVCSSDLICTNPLTGTSDAAAPASANLGALFPSADLSTADILPGRISARCEGRGILSVGPPPNMVGNYVLPGNNYQDRKSTRLNSSH